MNQSVCTIWLDLGFFTLVKALHIAHEYKSVLAVQRSYAYMNMLNMATDKVTS